MHILALRQKSLDNPDSQSILQEILNICALNPTPEAIRKLSDCKFLPVRLPSGERRWLDYAGEFAIIDRREYGDLFLGKIQLLDFSLEEIHPLKLFLSYLGLAERYMSKAVKEETTVEGGSFSRSLTKDLRNKSYAICR
jgi:hypothetical protein